MSVVWDLGCTGPSNEGQGNNPGAGQPSTCSCQVSVNMEQKQIPCGSSAGVGGLAYSCVEGATIVKGAACGVQSTVDSGVAVPDAGGQNGGGGKSK